MYLHLLTYEFSVLMLKLSLLSFSEEKPLEEIEIPPVASPSPPPPTSSPKGGRGGSGKKSKKGAPAMSVVAESEKASQKISEPPKEVKIFC